MIPGLITVVCNTVEIQSVSVLPDVNQLVFPMICYLLWTTQTTAEMLPIESNKMLKY